MHRFVCSEPVLPVPVILVQLSVVFRCAPRGIRTVFYFRNWSKKYIAQGNSPRLCDDIAIKRPTLLSHNFSCCSVSHAYDIHTVVCAVASLSVEVVDSVYGI